jgi:hypothetical protein
LGVGSTGPRFIPRISYRSGGFEDSFGRYLGRSDPLVREVPHLRFGDEHASFALGVTFGALVVVVVYIVLQIAPSIL